MCVILFLKNHVSCVNLHNIASKLLCCHDFCPKSSFSCLNGILFCMKAFFCLKFHPYFHKKKKKKRNIVIEYSNNVRLVCLLTITQCHIQCFVRHGPERVNFDASITFFVRSLFSDKIVSVLDRCLKRSEKT